MFKLKIKDTLQVHLYFFWNYLMFAIFSIVKILINANGISRFLYKFKTLFSAIIFRVLYIVNAFLLFYELNPSTASMDTSGCVLNF